MIGADILAFARPETGNRDDRPTGEMVVLQAKAVAAVCSAAGLDVEGRRVRPGVKKALAQSALIALGHLEANFTGEPQDYGKLPAQTSYLRAAFEVLGGKCATVLLTSLAAVPYPLPPVYWAPVLSRLPLLPSILFACRQSPASRSCVGVLTGRISRPPPDDREARMVLWSEEGLGRVFALAGLETAAKGTAARPLRVRRGESEKRTSLDGKRVADAVKGASEFLFGAGRADVAEQVCGENLGGCGGCGGGRCGIANHSPPPSFFVLPFPPARTQSIG
ncbi:MAG: hypothetical protein BJ554DRAFT_4591 [Olpidium bornovanus]|uniref:Uncharacterized protein n=1 Tax=Olpidium bornovanus TaxID=278681 RepID=A0A8H8DEZ5_9FUNG|nr:MAG: hypothetical protein BJ554DRAFT_4591 [Olpidium bornovanus]